MKKKVLLPLMGAVLAAGLMTGCGGSNDTKEESTKTESAAEADSEDTTDEAETTDSADGEEESTDSAADEQSDSKEEEASTEEAEDDSEDEADAADTEEADDEEDAGGDKAHVARTNSNYGDVVSAAGWNITVEDVEINASLENVSVDLGYTGVETSDYKKEADTGKTFCLIKLKIEKDGSKESLDWAKLKLTDSEGNEYTRTDDEFITELGMIRMAGTTLNFGSNEGWIAFEINENADGLELSYPFEAEAYNYAL
ncbi:DUF4352 domain-containing protein [Blautia glucerasea]|jgi:hypothetical protein|uniref:DUF4352 domain-containing protein n=1 Tax=Blautia glucerasea TaxID=536633 RepID=UPI001D009634|nr:DUF4352 domain-containing protein [Blautia glucerasea]MCB5386959.1 DUF4352 domain-containing protein [Blautia glucerasea]MCB5421575.1 DUF4352 domain-containing protein [Blautia luti]